MPRVTDPYSGKQKFTRGYGRGHMPLPEKVPKENRRRKPALLWQKYRVGVTTLIKAEDMKKRA